MWQAQIYCAMLLGVEKAGYKAKPGHVDELLKYTGWTVKKLYKLVMAYTAYGCGVRG